MVSAITLLMYSARVFEIDAMRSSSSCSKEFSIVESQLNEISLANTFSFISSVIMVKLKYNGENEVIKPLLY